MRAGHRVLCKINQIETSLPHRGKWLVAKMYKKSTLPRRGNTMRSGEFAVNIRHEEVAGEMICYV